MKKATKLNGQVLAPNQQVELRLFIRNGRPKGKINKKAPQAAEPMAIEGTPKQETEQKPGAVFLSIEQASRFLCLTEKMITQLIGFGSLPFLNPTGKNFLFDKEALSKWVADHLTEIRKILGRLSKKKLMTILEGSGEMNPQVAEIFATMVERRYPTPKIKHSIQ